jgi:hypothetical protein
MINYTLERCITNDDNWEHYCDLGCDETTAIEMWHYWQEKQPNYAFRMYKVTKELVAMSGNVKVFEIIPDGEWHDS